MTFSSGAKPSTIRRVRDYAERIHIPNGGWVGQRVRSDKQAITRAHIPVKQLLGQWAYARCFNDLDNMGQLKSVRERSTDRTLSGFVHMAPDFSSAALLLGTLRH
jgi:hypothetical protein